MSVPDHPELHLSNPTLQICPADIREPSSPVGRLEALDDISRVQLLYSLMRHTGQCQSFRRLSSSLRAAVNPR